MIQAVRSSSGTCDKVHTNTTDQIDLMLRPHPLQSWSHRGNSYLGEASEVTYLRHQHYTQPASNRVLRETMSSTTTFVSNVVPRTRNTGRKLPSICPGFTAVNNNKNYRKPLTFGNCTVRCCLNVDISNKKDVEKMLHDIQTIAGDSRGIFGQSDEDRQLLEDSIKTVELSCDTKDFTAGNARKAHGRWRLLYTTLEILGNRRIRLGLATPRKKGFVTLGDVIQTVDADTGRTSNIVYFNILGGITGTFSIEAEYTVENEKQVKVKTKSAKLEPAKLNKMLGENAALLTQIFNPEGTLHTTYLDDNIRVGRDGKGRLFVVEKL